MTILPLGCIDDSIQGDDRKLLEIHYTAEVSEGDSADQAILRGIKAVLADASQMVEVHYQGRLFRMWPGGKIVIGDGDAGGGDPAQPTSGKGGGGRAGGSVAALQADAVVADGQPGLMQQLTRTAELLKQQQAEIEHLRGQQAPVPVSERLPGGQLCWWYEPDENDGYGGRWTLLRIRGGTGPFTYWLPAHALPIPQGEVE